MDFMRRNNAFSACEDQCLYGSSGEAGKQRGDGEDHSLLLVRWLNVDMEVIE